MNISTFIDPQTGLGTIYVSPPSAMPTVRCGYPSAHAAAKEDTSQRRASSTCDGPVPVQPGIGTAVCMRCQRAWRVNPQRTVFRP